MSTPVVVRRRLVVTGVVQGVGFRPYLHRLATGLGLAGFVGNDAAGVFVEVEGPGDAVECFVARLASEAPPLAQVESLHQEDLMPHGAHGFVIVASGTGEGPRTLVPPDVAVCEACLSEVLTPGDRRWRHPFANCTDCGPRFTVIRRLPYDRPHTTMAGFTMCAACRAEYEDPGNRRYHAQPIACPECGPRLAWRAGSEELGGTDAVIAAFHRTVAGGGIVAVKGLGGYHLAADATSDAALDTLRRRKGRGDKPFAVMVADLAAAREFATVDEAEAEALTSPAHPIVLLRRRPGSALSALVAPGNPLVGVMLPYTPLHHLLFQPVPGHDTPVPAVLVLTSGNRSDEPICTGDDEAAARLADLADAFVLHDRPIAVPCDDSVVRVVEGEVLPVRRSRGYAPLPVTLPVEVRPTLASGAELKNTFCLSAGRHAWVGPHVGDMENLETLRAFERGVAAFEQMYAVVPEVWAADAHPGYLTRRWVLQQAPSAAVVEVQHHHAHVAAVMAEHGLDGTEPVIGVAFDGTGYGRDADGRPQIWGGEFLLADYQGFRRVGHLRQLPLPGGDAAVANPCRVALAYLTALGLPTSDGVPAVGACDATERAVVARQVEQGVGCVPTTSMGRLFDAVSSLVGVRHRVSYEAQAAMELEAAAEQGEPHVDLCFAVGPDGVVDPAPVLAALVAGVRAGVPVADLAAAFHEAVARMVVDVVRLVTADGPRRAVALTGGVFQNALLTRLTRAGLRAEGYEVLTHRLVPPNDGGLALGQAVIAGMRRG